ncbi:MAG TPA: bifunctional phosphoribosylaminoimidazolecarboxamide formyltransferase/IMP cyclohydrolase, partial [Fimbriimonadaceae bacterium]|nr:bifunctional phosphoribosylaminoimidazolecarboxamide formyltransferase/IMP cyclohydrolase [Fimbriimonadaceae bacterium]
GRSVKRALLSVTDKTGIVDFARALVERGYELISTGGTAKALRDAGLSVKDVSEVTSFPEMMDGRLKTLHPLVHGGLLGDRRLPQHVAEMEAAGIYPIDLLCVNLYAFEKTVNGPHRIEDAIESIDIGGPAMIRAASKNHANVTVVVDPADYPVVLESLGSDLSDLRKRLAAKAFRHTAFYDSMISRYLTKASGEDELSETLTIGMRRTLAFRYGENPHQKGALYQDPMAQPGIAQAEQLWGKALSYNNLNDGDGAWELAADLPVGACAIIKHGNPCGAALGSDLGDSYRLARESDPISAFGGIAAFHGEIDESAALAMTEKGNFLEVVIGTSFSNEALEIFKTRSGWGQDVRLLAAPLPPREPSLSIKSIRGGAIVQESDEDPGLDWKLVTDRPPSDEELASLRFLWSVIPHVKSNAIVVGTATRLLGVGAGQMNRVQSVRLALEQAGEKAKGAGLASDAFFPFPDSVETAHAAGITAIVQPGGSKKDPDVIARANELGIAMMFTGARHFRH